MFGRSLLALASMVLVLVPMSALGQVDIAAIPFESVPGGTTFISAGGAPIGLEADTNVTGTLTATGELVSDSGVWFPDGSAQVTAGVGAPGASANQGLYSNTITDFSPPNAYTEVCFKGGVMDFDIHAVGEPTDGGSCLPGDVGWILERFERAAASWTTARATCLMDGMRLAEPFEWQYSCDNAAMFALDSMTGNWEWASNTANTQIRTNHSGSAASPAAGNGGCDFFSWGDLGNTVGVRTSFVYRCAR